VQPAAKSLPRTGADVLSMLEGAAALVVGGSILLLLGRRKRRTAQS
jgi:LPXTG-motif cell wall-anchored protein